MTSVPPTARRAQQPPKDFLSSFNEAMSRVDGCPECVTNTEAPFAVMDTPQTGYIAGYRCADCGHEWSTSWRD